MKYRGISLLLVLSQLPFIFGIMTLLSVGLTIGGIFLILLYRTNIDQYFNRDDKTIKICLLVMIILSILMLLVFGSSSCVSGELNTFCDSLLNVWLFIFSIVLTGMIIFLLYTDKK